MESDGNLPPANGTVDSIETDVENDQSISAGETESDQSNQAGEKGFSLNLKNKLRLMTAIIQLKVGLIKKLKLIHIQKMNV